MSTLVSKHLHQNAFKIIYLPLQILYSLSILFGWSETVLRLKDHYNRIATLLYVLVLPTCTESKVIASF